MKSFAPFGRFIQEAESIFDVDVQEDQGLSSSFGSVALFDEDSNSIYEIGDVDFEKEFEELDENIAGEDVAHSLWKS